MKIGYIQNDPVFGEKERNFEQIHSMIEDIQTDLLVLPELFATGYTFTSKEEAYALSETIDGPTAIFLKEISLQTSAIVVGGFVEKENDIIYNSALIVNDGQVIDTYRKLHLFNKEKVWFTPGNKPLKVYEINGIRLGVMICFDWIFPEVCRTLALKEMQVLAHPSNLVMPYCQSAMVTRCLENRIFAVTTNRIGTEQRGEDHFTFTGASQITDTDGTILSSAPKEKPHLAIVEIDETMADQKLMNDHNDVIKDRRTDFYEL